ncbi:hypothetical protein llap_2118 [Limosa lapponica baueri]|uniref:Uncharacterized protein n=1 Tax=Limosa lapponica baueri TaxID=1758121 RepID=A0A2I0UNF6_LIMLA|nr:hypothetical protein llap_2118 [Limosa lapponica baueri]
MKNKVTTLDFGRADCGLFKYLLGGVVWDKALEGRGTPGKLGNIQGSSPPSLRVFHPNEYEVRQKYQEAYTWMNKMLLAKPKHKKEAYIGYPSAVTLKEYRNIVQASQEKLRKTKAQMELNAVRNVKGK